jgi:hypothetical protein
MNSNKLFIIVLCASIPFSVLISFLIFKIFGKSFSPSIIGMGIILMYILYSVLFIEDENT